ncbi:hypothetical protein CEXT_272481 [Caerostris extrusa]|uniref:Uncharacterized protein n=1 Tax=Caerostris extrusa TaxID=172846 RepID=A0AAV4SWN1_CAEEX|nr:hypothetical protein CEXT_272481 [Caerostris extrusa]
MICSCVFKELKQLETETNQCMLLSCRPMISSSPTDTPGYLGAAKSKSKLRGRESLITLFLGQGREGEVTGLLTIPSFFGYQGVINEPLSGRSLLNGYRLICNM